MMVKNKKIICVDLDGVIISYRKGWLGKDKFGKVLRGAKTYLKKLIWNGWWVIIYTCRGDRDKVGNYLFDNGVYKGVHYSDINRRKNVLEGTYRGKCGADMYIDDRNIEFDGDWKKVYRKIVKFRPWEEKNSREG